MKRNVIGIASVVIALAVTCSVAANLKTGAVCPKPVVAKKAAAAKPNTKAKATTAAKALAKRTESRPKPLPRLLDLGATTCVPCKMMAKVLDELRKDYKGKLQVDFIDVKKDAAAVAKYNIKLIPLQIFYDAKGKELYRHEGYYPKADIVKKFKELGIDLAK